MLLGDQQPLLSQTDVVRRWFPQRGFSRQGSGPCIPRNVLVMGMHFMPARDKVNWSEWGHFVQ